MTRRDLTIRLDLHLEDDEVCGHASDDGAGSGRDFRGWLGLIAALDDLMGEPPRGSPPPAAPAAG